MLIFAVALACAVGPAVPAGAQEGDVVDVGGVPYAVHAGKLYTLDDPAVADSSPAISVTGSNVDRKKKRVVHAEIVSSDQIAETGAHTLADVLQDQAGIQVGSSFGLGQEVTMDGLDGRQVLVLVDGRPVKGRVDSHVDVSRISVSASSIERIEIVRGPMSALYGSEAIGGVINIVTKKATQDVGGEVEAGGEVVEGAVWENAGVHAHGGAGPVAARVDVNVASLPGIDRNNDGKADLPDRRQLGLHAEAVTAIGDNVSYKAQLDGSDSQSVARTSGVAPFSERDRTDDWGVSSTFDVDTAGFSGKGGEASADLRIDRVRRVFDKLPSGSSIVPPSFCAQGGLPWDDACPAAPQVNTDATEDEARLEVKYKETVVENAPFLDELTAAVGAVLTREQAQRVDGKGNDTLPGDKERDIASGYGELLWRPLPWLSVLPGGRVDVFTPAAQNENVALGPKIGARVDLPLGFAVRAMYGKGFRLPSYEERLLRFDHSELGYVVVGNPDLLPEKSDGFRGEILFEPMDEISLSTEAYLNLVENLIDFGAPTGTDPATGADIFEYTNIGRSYTAGINVHALVGPFFGFKLDGGYQYLINAVNASACPSTNPWFCSAAEGARSLPLRPAHALDASVRYKLRATSTTLFARVDALSERPVDAHTTAPPYAELSFGVRQPISFKKDGTAGSELTVTLLDVNDAYDATFGPKPGRAVSVLLRVFD